MHKGTTLKLYISFMSLKPCDKEQLHGKHANWDGPWERRYGNKIFFSEVKIDEHSDLQDTFCV